MWPAPTQRHNPTPLSQNAPFPTSTPRSHLGNDALLSAPCDEWNFSTMPLCTYPTLIETRLLSFTLPVTTSSADISSNLNNTCARTLTNCPYSVSEPRPHDTSHLTFTLPMTTHSPLMTNAIASLTSPSRWWVMIYTPSYTTPTLPTSLNPPSSALPAPFEGMTFPIGPQTPHSNKPLFSSALVTLNSFTNTAIHGPLYLHYVYTTHLLSSIPLSQTPTLSLSRARTVAPLLPCQPPPRGYPV